MSSFEYWLWIKFAPRPENSRKWIKQWHTVLSRVPLNSFIIHNFWIKWRKCGTRRPVPAPLSTFDAATHIERHQVRRAQVALCRQSIKSWFTYTALDLHTKLSCKLTLIWVYDLNVWINHDLGATSGRNVIHRRIGWTCGWWRTLNTGRDWPSRSSSPLGG